MQSIHLEKKEQVEPLDEATHAALDEAEAAIQRGEIVTLEQSRTNARERYKAWRKSQKTEAIPA